MLFQSGFHFIYRQDHSIFTVRIILLTQNQNRTLLCWKRLNSNLGKQHVKQLAWKSFSGVFKRGLVLFSLNNFSRFLFFLVFYYSVVLFLADITSGACLTQCCLAILLVSLVSLFVLYTNTWSIDQSYPDKSFISEKTIWLNCKKNIALKIA